MGYEDNTFKPDQFLTREEMIVLKVVVNGDLPKKTNNNVFKFTDYEEIDPRYTGYIFRSYFSPNTVTRAFGNTRLLKPKQNVLGYEAVASIWQFNLSPTAKEVVEKLEKTNGEDNP